MCSTPPSVPSQRLENRCRSAPARFAATTCSVPLHRQASSRSCDNIVETVMLDAPPLVVVASGSTAAAIEEYLSPIDTEPFFPASVYRDAAHPSPRNRVESCPPWFISCASLENDTGALGSERASFHHSELSGMSTDEHGSCVYQKEAEQGRAASSSSQLHMLGGWGALLNGEEWGALLDGEEMH